jgi:hypothetical protein
VIRFRDQTGGGWQAARQAAAASRRDRDTDPRRGQHSDRHPQRREAVGLPQPGLVFLIGRRRSDRPGRCPVASRPTRTWDRGSNDGWPSALGDARSGQMEADTLSIACQSWLEECRPVSEMFTNSAEVRSGPISDVRSRGRTTDAATYTALTRDRSGRCVALSRRQKITILGSEGLPVCTRRPLEGFLIPLHDPEGSPPVSTHLNTGAR